MTLQLVKSEIAYDLIQDHLDVLLKVLEAPLSRESATELFGDEVTLARFVKHGLLKYDDNGLITGTTEGIRQSRREGMMTFLERYIVPALSLIHI